MFKLVAITPQETIPNETLAIRTLLEEGDLYCLHLRKPNWSLEQTYACIAAIPESFHSKIRLHDHYTLTKYFQLGGLHLNARHPNYPENYKGSISCSCHSLEEVINMQASKEYVFLSPIFDSVSKKNYQSQFSKTILQKASENKIINSKVFALGGVKMENIPLLKSYGFGGAALIGSLWESYIETGDIRLLLSNLRQLQRSCL
ncbi:MAG: thiamine phosphate synthase [Bacteroidales bacterium]